MTARVFTIPPSAPFLPTFVTALLDGTLVPGFAPRRNPLALSSATVFLPTRRAARALSHAILDALGADAAFLPAIVPLGDVDEDALAFSDQDFTLPPAIDPARRRLVLARLVLKLAEVLPAAIGDRMPLIAPAPPAAVALADDLARLFDDLTIADLKLEVLKDAALPEHDQYWRISFEFLEIAHREWSKILVAAGLSDPAARRDALLKREAERIANDSSGPVIAAGSTGTLPAVANLLGAIARRPDGAVVLPGLDQMLDDESFALIDGGKTGDTEIEPSPGHPQFGLKRLIGRLGLSRQEIVPLAPPTLAARERLLSEAFRPAATTERWRTGAEIKELSGVTVIEAPDARSEALAIAVCLREAIEPPGMRSALVTPDRALARRVGAELLRWGIEVEDSAGVKLADTEAGRFARLIATAAAERLAPVPLIACLRHPLADFGAGTDTIDCLEIAVLRGPRPAAGAGIIRAVADARALSYRERDLRSRFQPQQWDAALALTRKVVDRFQPLLALAEHGPARFSDIVTRHTQTLAAVGLDLARATRDDTRQLAEAFSTLAALEDGIELSLTDYSDTLAALLADYTVYPAPDRDGRVRILGPLEARLLTIDRMVIGGVNESTWPLEARNDSWLNRPMRKALGLDLPERRVGLSAHDFAQAAGARELIIARARKQNGVETVASRFLQRIQAVVPAAAWKAAAARGDRYLQLAHALEEPIAMPRIARPEPRPPATARPARLSVTEIETLIRDPYSIYARHVLRLVPLEEIDAEPDARDRGTLLHLALAEFVRSHPAALPDNAAGRLIALGRQAFEKYTDFPGVLAVWWPRFERMAHWFVAEEAERRRELKAVAPEIDGKLELEIAGRPFTLSARADRIELRRDGTVAILDYKTGQAPTFKEALVGLAPQLPLEAAIARAGGFKDIPVGTGVREITVMRLTGRDPAGEVKPLRAADASKKTRELAQRLEATEADGLATLSRAQLEALLRQFANAASPYHSVPRPKWRGRFPGEYDHLARIKEWLENGGVIEE
jgi:ATP-dependent helicase/nuclease subunit B